MSVRSRVEKLEKDAGNQFKVVVTQGEFFDKHGNPISTENGWPPNLKEDVHRAIVSVSDSEETVTLQRRQDESGAEFMRRFDQTGIEIGKKVGTTVCLPWDAKWT
ncbi:MULTISPECIES: hypothetical protein [Ruegeria]|uniref:Uncharacterized protein n=1 Tax=Ruegeria atlantica TaxID=81569 RepID=A0ABX1WEU0_9RHOB|nr:MULTISPECIES: hypothetical protein [Ruegeria]NOC84586.1 hypothetical protein [Ruegeria sp. HKCCD6428]NOD31810.1 hypothetical protein [Ruegeria atlantica]